MVQAQTLQNWNWATLFGMCRCSKYVGTMVLVVSSPSQLLTAWPREDLSRPWKALVRSWLCRWWPWMSQPFCFESWFPHTEFWNDRTAFLVFLIEFFDLDDLSPNSFDCEDQMSSNQRYYCQDTQRSHNFSVLLWAHTPSSSPSQLASLTLSPLYIQ